MRQQLWTGIGAASAMAILILDGKTAITGAQDGIALCLQTVIPSLFPFILLSILLTNTLLGHAIPLLRPLGRLFHLPSGSESLLICAFLGGYPVGAQTVSSLFQNGQLPRSTADRMLTFCNNAGPAFLFGMTAAVFPQAWVPWTLWGIQIISALLVARLFLRTDIEIPYLSPSSSQRISSVLMTSIRVMASVCGWVVLFRIIIAFSKRWFLWLLPNDIQILITGLLELSNGCCELPGISSPELQFLICCGMLTIGGLCVTMQTLSVTAGLSPRFYIIGKLVQTVFSILLALTVILKSIIPTVPFVLLFLFTKMQNRDRIPETVGV